MRTCLGIFFGIIFLVVSSFFILTINLNKTVYNPIFDKKVINESGLYKSVPETLISMVSTGQISANGEQLSQSTKDIIINTIQTVLTPDILKKHAESIIDQTFSEQNVVREDLSDINNAVNSNLSEEFSQMMGISISANKENSFVPQVITFDKSQSQIGQSIVYHKKILWISLAGTLLFLLLLFFCSADNYKSRLKWTAGFMAVATFFALINYLTFRLLGFDWIVKIINNNSEQPWINNINIQIMAVLALIKLKISFYYLIEFISLVLLTILLFVLAALIPPKQSSAVTAANPNQSTNANKEDNNAQKKS